MSNDKLPEEVSDFINGYIDTALQLEILLLLQKHPERSWTAVEIDAELRINREWVAQQLGELNRRELLRRTEAESSRYQYAPASSKLASDVSLVASWYTTHRVAITSAIYQKPTEKLRIFADAFRLRRDKPNG